MKKSLLLSFILILTFFTGISQVNVQWQVRYSSTGANVDRAQDMVMDAAGNVYVTGIARGASGNFDYVTIKYNSAGVQQWLSEYNGPGNSLDEAHAVTIDTSGNVYVTGWSYGGAGTGYDYATIKYNSAGAQQWASRYNNTTNGTDEAFDIGVDFSGNVYVTGTSDGSGVNSAAATVKYNSSGTQTALIRFEGAGNQLDAGYSIYVDPTTGTTYVAGYTFQSTANDFNFLTVKYNSSLVQQWSAQYNGPSANYDEARSIAVDAAGNVYVTGNTQTTVLTNFNYATVKYDAAGVQQWAQTYNGTGDDADRANVVKLDASGNIYVTGKSVGVGSTGEDIYTIKYDNSGATLWANRYNGTSNGYDEGKDLEVDLSGNVYVAGLSFEAGASTDYILIKYDAAGTQQWKTQYNGTGNNSDQAAGLEVDNAGNIYVTGYSKGAGTVEDYETIKYCQLQSNAGIDTTICNGASVTLNASAAGGVSYSWMPVTGLSNPSIANPVATPTTTTDYIVAITNATGCVDLDTVTVTVIPLPSPAITPSGPTSFCSGGSVTLMSAPASTYQWSTGVNDTLSSITVSISGTYSVIVSNGFGCSSSTSQTVTVFALPTINAGMDDSTCLSTNVNLMATGGVSYVWHPGTTVSDSTIANPVAGPVNTTTYWVVGTASGGCSNTDSVTITVLGNPGLPTISKVEDTLTCSPTYFAYQWYMNGSPISGAISQTYVVTGNGTYYVEVFNNLGCSSVSTVITVNDVSVNELVQATLLNVFPNPTASDVMIELVLATASDVTITVNNIAGQLISRSELKSQNGVVTRKIDLKENPNGIYYLQIITGNEVINRKIIKN
ncbi:MAG: SBBP repeat-containing protein [Bacteroidota bacterium]|nr:SBBP repeat-containing protein [Bacteroidota bacterium]